MQLKLNNYWQVDELDSNEQGIARGSHKYLPASTRIYMQQNGIYILNEFTSIPWPRTHKCGYQYRPSTKTNFIYRQNIEIEPKQKDIGGKRV